PRHLLAPRRITRRLREPSGARSHRRRNRRRPRSRPRTIRHHRGGPEEMNGNASGLLAFSLHPLAFPFVNALKRLQAQTAAALDALLPSILDKAFKGEP